MEPIKHDLRLSEVLSPFGVGAIVDVLGESLIAADTSWWDEKASNEIICERLRTRLGCGKLIEPPTHAGRIGKNTAALRYWRFPAWRFCERCDRLSDRTGRMRGKWSNTCDCGGRLVPMRYVAVCEGGSHVQDIDWVKWTHRGPGVDNRPRCHDYKSLRFTKAADKGEGLRALMVTCHRCGTARSLDELTSKGALRRDGLRCDGRQPWELAERGVEPCPHPLVAAQRGATSNYIAEKVAALVIPEVPTHFSELNAKIRANRFFDNTKIASPGGEALAGYVVEDLGDPDVTIDMVLAVAAEESGVAAPDDIPVSDVLLDLKDGEWAAFQKKLGAGRDRSGEDFVVDGFDLDKAARPEALSNKVSGIGQVRRLREVQVLKGFRRHTADAALIRPYLGRGPRSRDVYPAIEMYGEGIFIRFDEDQLAEWESQPAVQQRAALLADRRAATTWASRLDVPEPRYIALHTFSHLIIRRLAFESGYASASLRERIYANSDRADKTAGVLIYTADGDAQGTLGGLVRLGDPKRLAATIVGALDDADFCSNDPVCIESDIARVAQLNLSACHGCCLVSETSCESRNRLLDRKLLLGGDGVPGLLAGVLPEVRSRR
ncbi:DrmB family protein [Nocardia sp. NPDC055053]